MNSTPSIRVEMQGPLAVVSLAQPARGNPFDGEFTRDFKSVAASLWDRHEAGDLRGVLLRADGPNYSYGGDLKSFYPVRDKLPALVREWTGNLHMGLQRFWQLPVPVVTAVQGFAMGGGVALLAGCDVVLAAASASFGSAFAQLGFSCDSGSTATLTARMGAARARRFVMLAEVLGAEEALAAGLADRIVPDEQLGAEALALAQRLAAGPTLALGEVKRLFLRAGTDRLTSILEDEALTLARVSGSADAKEGIAAMVERRKPAFQGR
jgi:2-(1,2-epoxy-1,2-dihydrophenyl)acetyl-CoA isomerase